MKQESEFDRLTRTVLNLPFKGIDRLFGLKLGKKVKFFLALTITIIYFIPPIINNLNQFTSGLVEDKETEEQIITPTPLPQISTPLKDAQVLGEAERACQGRSLNITELDDVEGKEKPFHPDLDDLSIVSASESANFQVTKRYPFPCRPPWLAIFSFIPRKENSIGVFFEYEDVFKITFGDGDRLTWVLQKNDQGTRKLYWTEVGKKKLSKGKITTNREVIIEVKVEKIVGNLVYLTLRIGYQPENKTQFEWVEYKEVFLPQVANLAAKPARAFRMGINDYRFKGLGSEIKFGTFSIKSL